METGAGLWQGVILKDPAHVVEQAGGRQHDGGRTEVVLPFQEELSVLVFLGGGAALLKRHLSATDGLCRPLILDDVSLNAKGYERLVGQMSRGVGHGG